MSINGNKHSIIISLRRKNGILTKKDIYAILYFTNLEISF